MRFFRSKSLLALAAALLPGVAHAQGFGTIGSYQQPMINPSPTYSPYLNLNRPGASAAQNYFGLVQPQLQAQRNFQQIQNQLNAQSAGTGDVGYVDPSGQFMSYYATNAAGLQTGHNVAYFNYSHYYNFQQSSRAFGGGGRAGFPYGGLGGFGSTSPYGSRGLIGGGAPFYSGLNTPFTGGLSTGMPMPFFFAPTSGGTGGMAGMTTGSNP